MRSCILSRDTDTDTGTDADPPRNMHETARRPAARMRGAGGPQARVQRAQSEHAGKSPRVRRLRWEITKYNATSNCCIFNPRCSSSSSSALLLCAPPTLSRHSARSLALSVSLSVLCASRLSAMSTAAAAAAALANRSLRTVRAVRVHLPALPACPLSPAHS